MDTTLLRNTAARMSDADLLSAFAHDCLALDQADRDGQDASYYLAATEVECAELIRRNLI